MNDGWASATLQELTTKIGSGATPKGGQKSYKIEGISLIRSLNVHDREFRNKKLALIDKAQAKLLCNVVLEKDDVLLNITGASIARCCIVPACYLPARVNQHVSILRTRQELIDPNFLCYLLTSREYKEQLLQTGEKQGATRQALTKSLIQNFSITFPKDLAEQKQIVAILDEAFAAIATAKAAAEKNLANARELFESYLNRVFTQKGDGWEEKNLADVALAFGRGKSRHRPRNDKSLYGGKYPFIQTGEIRSADHYVIEYSKTYNKKGLAQSRLWPAGTLCITIAANIAETAILTFDACIPDSVIGLLCDPDKANVEFVEYQLQFFKTMLQAQGKGAAQDNINMGTFERNEFPFAPLSDQVDIVLVLNRLSSKVNELETIYERKLTNLAELKQSLLQKAFTGQLTAKRAELEVAV